MRHNYHRSGRMALAIAVLAAASGSLAREGAPVEVAPYKLVLENDRVRVLEFDAKPHQGVCGVGMHSHPAHLTVVLDPADIKITLPDGQIIRQASVKNAVFWSEAQTHSAENVGSTVSRALLIEVK